MNKIKKFKNIAGLIIIGLIGLYSLYQNNSSPQHNTEQSSPSASHTSSLHNAIANKAQDIQVEGKGHVVAILPDDNKGSRHQKFILKVDNGTTVLVAHNIDLAPRIDGIQKGDSVAFYGEYIWNEKGGVVHWTHYDPNNKHPHGWLKHNNRTYSRY